MFLFSDNKVQITINILLNDCNSATTQKLTFGVNTTCNNTSTIVSWIIPSYMSLLSDAVIFLSPIVLTTNGQFLGSGTIAFSERYVTVEVEFINWLDKKNDSTESRRVDNLSDNTCFRFIFPWRQQFSV